MSVLDLTTGKRVMQITTSSGPNLIQKVTSPTLAARLPSACCVQAIVASSKLTALVSWCVGDRSTSAVIVDRCRIAIGIVSGSEDLGKQDVLPVHE